MAKYKFQFKTGHIYDGSIEVAVNDFVGEVKGAISPSLAQTIEANGGQLMTSEPTKTKAKKRKVAPVKWSAEETAEGGEK